MKIFTDFNYNPDLSLAFGFFDGVHQGHRCVIKNAVNVAAQNGVKSAVVTFKESPKSFFCKTKKRQLISTEKRLELTEKLGVNYVYLLSFDEKLAELTAQEYLEQKIMLNLSPKAITTGFNHTLGCDCATSHFLKQNQVKYNYRYFEIPPITWNNQLISTSEIKYLISQADFQKANHLLGYDFCVEGTVIEGNKIGRKISFPTANVLHPKDIIEFPFGVYFAKTVIAGRTFNGILNYGIKPTVTDLNLPLLEIHIFDFSKDIYGEKIKIIPIKQIREERKFDSLEKLKKQISEDSIVARKFFSNL